MRSCVSMSVALHRCASMYFNVLCGSYLCSGVENPHFAEKLHYSIGKVIALHFSALHLTMHTSLTHRLFSEKTRQWYIANFARSRAGRWPWPSFPQFERAKAVPLATPAKRTSATQNTCAWLVSTLSTLLHVTCYIVAWQTYRQTEYNTSLPLAGEVKNNVYIAALVYLSVRLCTAYIRTESKSLGAVWRQDESNNSNKGQQTAR